VRAPASANPCRISNPRSAARPGRQPTNETKATSARCPLWGALRTQLRHRATSHKCQFATKCDAATMSLFYHLIGEGNKGVWNSKTEHLGRLEVDAESVSYDVSRARGYLLRSLKAAVWCRSHYSPSRLKRTPFQVSTMSRPHRLNNQPPFRCTAV
jgi:hypothetical protein